MSAHPFRKVDYHQWIGLCSNFLKPILRILGSEPIMCQVNWYVIPVIYTVLLNIKCQEESRRIHRDSYVLILAFKSTEFLTNISCFRVVKRASDKFIWQMKNVLYCINNCKKSRMYIFERKELDLHNLNRSICCFLGKICSHSQLLCNCGRSSSFDSVTGTS